MQCCKCPTAARKRRISGRWVTPTCPPQMWRTVITWPGGCDGRFYVCDWGLGLIPDACSLMPAPGCSPALHRKSSTNLGPVLSGARGCISTGWSPAPSPGLQAPCSPQPGTLKNHIRNEGTREAERDPEEETAPPRLPPAVLQQPPPGCSHRAAPLAEPALSPARPKPPKARGFRR